MPRFTSLRGRGLLFLLFLWFIWFMNFNGRLVFTPILPLLEDEFHVSHARAASIFTFVTLGYALALSFAGPVTTCLGRKRTILLSMSVSGVVLSIIPFIDRFELFFPAAFLLAFALGVHLPTIIPIITNYYSEGVWGKVIAFHESASSVSIFAAPFVALFILSFLPWRGIFMIFAILLLLGAVAFGFSTTDVKIQPGTKLFQPQIFRSRAFWIMGTTWGFSSGSLLGLYYVMPLYLVKELSMSVQQGNAIFGLSRLGGIAVALGASLFVDRVNLRKTLFFFALATGGMTMLLALATAAWVKPLLFMQASVATGLFPVALVAISRMFDVESRGPATGFIITLGMAGSAVFPWLIGLSGDLVSFRLGIFLLGLLTALSSGLLFLLKQLRRQPNH